MANTKITSANLDTLTTLTVDDITLDGSTISDAGDLTLDIGGTITLDTDSGGIYFKDGGTTIGEFINSSSDFMLKSAVQDKDILLKGNDGGSTITALTLDMSDAGKAIFNSDLTIGNAAGSNQTLQVTNDNGNFQLQKYSDDVYLNLNDNGSIIFRHYGSSGSSVSQIMSILPSGNVGIGTSSPGTELQVGDYSNNSEQITIATASDQTGRINFYNNNNTEGASIRVTGGGNGAKMYFANRYDSDTDRVTFDLVNGYLGVGITSPQNTLHVHTGSTDSRMQFTNGSSGSAYADGLWVGHDNTQAYFMHRENLPITLWTNATERMRIENNGDICIGTTVALRGSEKVSISGGNADAIFAYTHAASMVARKASFSNGFFFLFEANNGTAIGSVTSNGSSTTYNTSSDYRLKENIKPMKNGLDRLNKLNPVSFDWKETGINSEGFLAHEVDEVFSDCVYGEKDGDEIQSMDYGRITPLLVKAIQEQQTIIDDLKSRIETLEG